MAYGFDIEPDPEVKGYKMTMVAVPQQSIRVKKEGNTVRCEVIIDGRPAVLEKMFINATDGLTGPQVHYIEIHGTDLQTAEKRSEKIMRK
jgi:hypothetical protein